MNTLLIVEDNDFERNALQHYIDWDVLGVRVVDTAYNGRDGLEKASRLRPDMIISDVKMPVMDGMEMAKAIVQGNPDTKFIFSSGHDDVELVKEALELRAYSYLTKPLRPEELIKVVKKMVSASMDEKLSQRASQKIKEQFQHNLQHLQAKFLEELMLGKLKQEDANLIYAQAHDLQLPMTGAYRLAMMEVDDAVPSDFLEKAARLNLIHLELQAAPELQDVMLLKSGDNRIIAILHSLKHSGSGETRTLGIIDNRMAALAEKHAFRYVIGVSQEAPNLSDFRQLYEQCSISLHGKVDLGYGLVIPFEQVRNRTAERLEPELGMDPAKLIDRIVAGVCDGKDCGEDVERLITAMAAERPIRLERIQSACIGLFSRIAKKLQANGENLEEIGLDEVELYQSIITARTIPDLATRVRQFTQIITAARISDQPLSLENSAVQEIVHILNQEFNQPITLAYLSERVFLSPNYLRILFKAAMNISIQDYLTQLRIDKAKELLQRSPYKVHEIGEMVGYENGTYFNHVFKSNVQMTPREYRSKHLSKRNGA